MASFEFRNGRVRARIYRRGVRKCATFPSEAQAREWARRQEMVLEATVAPRIGDSQRLAKFQALRGTLPSRYVSAASKVSYSHDEIVASAFPAQCRTGIYFLINRARVTYVGQTTDLFQRLWKHQRSGREFDSFAFIPCASNRLDEIEAAYIAFLMPGENKMFG